ncbi:MAG: hypothetical protein WBV06_17840 [Acidimicrobiia bacterium]
MSKRALSVVLVALVFAGCTLSPGNDAAGGMLVIVDGDGNVATVAPDGSRITTLTEDATIGEPYFQPVWSPDGSAIAYSRLTGTPTLYVAAADGSTTAMLPTESTSFYFSWSIDNDLLFLRNTTSGLSLDLTSFDGTQLDDPRSIDAGAPLYFSWEPGGSRLATHISLDRLELNDLEESSDLGVVPGSFQAPQWTESGIAAVEMFSGSQRLVLVSADGAVEPVAALPGPAVFAASADGSRIAVQSVLTDDALSAVYQALPAVSPNRLVVVTPGDGDVVTVSDGLAGAFFWSPDGSRLLVLDVVSDTEASWSVWDGTTLAEVAAFRPPPSYVANFLPFFDQYAQSVSLWSPDGSAFAFPGTVDGESGVWVQKLDGTRTRVSDGTWVAWSRS